VSTLISCASQLKAFSDAEWQGAEMLHMWDMFSCTVQYGDLNQNTLDELQYFLKFRALSDVHICRVLWMPSGVLLTELNDGRIVVWSPN
jgi:hypothetical protein